MRATVIRALDAAVEQDTRLRVTLGDDLENAGLCHKIPNDFNRLLGRGQQVNVADDFLGPAQTARRAATDHVRMLPQTVEQRFGNGKCIAETMLGGVLPFARDAFEQVGLGLLAKPFEFGNLAGLAGGFELGDGIHAGFLLRA